LRLRHFGRLGRVAEDVVWAKLASLRDGARLASERLFSRGGQDRRGCGNDRFNCRQRPRPVQ
jgi:hypothetical protein